MRNEQMSYSNPLSKMLENIGAKEGSKLSIDSKGKTYTGTLMPHHDFSDQDVVVIKLSSGYNIGIRVDGKTTIKVLEQPEPRPKKEAPAISKKGLPNISLIGTGGTISSGEDNKTGALHPSLSASELVDSVPGLREIANISSRSLFSLFSENIGVEHWQKLAEAVAEEINKGADAVMILHGTDTMGYTASALSFMLGDIPKPVVLVGAQRSPDRPSSDAPTNLLAAARFCVSGNTAGVYVIMHEGLGDDRFAVHIGTRVRKMHTTRRDAFKSMNVPPAAIVDEKGAIIFATEGRKASAGKAVAKTKMERSVVLIHFYPGMDPSNYEEMITKSKGIVIAGTGLGHVSSEMVQLIKKASDNGSVVAIASQCLSGTTNLNAYSTGRDMQKAGAISVKDMLPETAYVKLMWVLANSKNAEEAKKLMTASLAEEMGDRRSADV